MEHSKKGRALRKNPSDPNVKGKRRATIMKRIHMARKMGERIPVTFDENGQPEGKHGDELMKTVTSFIVDESFRIACIKSCGEAAWNFRHDLYKTFIEGFLKEGSVWTRPQKVVDNYPNIEEEDWLKFVQSRSSLQFQQLSDRGSEIRTNNEYSSRGGRDGYRKLDQEKFKKTGKWERRDGLWLEQQMNLNEELKDPACKKASELIMEYNTQESQGTFESVGTSDVLSHALSSPEHKGRVRGQSKFVKPSDYFNLNRSSSKDNEIQSMRHEIEELKALVRGLCANKDVAPSVDPNNVSTVDQHNSFKASCSAQEKQHGGGQVLVAFGRAWLESLPTDTVHGIPLGEGNVRVSINVPKLKKSPLPIPTYEATTVEDAINGFVAWPKTLVELDTSMNKASRGPSHVPDPASGKKKNAKESLEIKPSTLGQSSMRQGNQIEVPIPYTIMTFEMPVFLSFEDIFEFINLKEISANCILVYMRYLEELYTEDASMRDRADNLISFLRDAPKGRLYLVPHNRGRHWVLGIIDPWEDLVLYFDPLREKKREDFTELMNMAQSDWKIMAGEGIRRRQDYKTKISNRPCPVQEGSVECGYFILGFMRDIVLNGIDVLEMYPMDCIGAKALHPCPSNRNKQLSTLKFIDNIELTLLTLDRHGWWIRHSRVVVEVAAAVAEKGERGEGGVEGNGRMKEKGGRWQRHRENEREGKASAGRAAALSAGGRRR
ncbi:hypothetical protein TIFTF001_026786 [Ficus carica]|uniref:Ubiquitin-like protease family profile domain-containing protein n=1 Tax=Ficus carica TaxID=3494 RepID=A0AA88DLX3_FICCA|nr:hypothetical protein TIFTF001_026786 [Ficus carica]